MTESSIIKNSPFNFASQYTKKLTLELKNIGNTLDFYRKINFKIDVPIGVSGDWKTSKNRLSNGAAKVDFVERLKYYFRKISSQTFHC